MMIIISIGLLGWSLIAAVAVWALSQCKSDDRRDVTRATRQRQRQRRPATVWHNEAYKPDDIAKAFDKVKK